MIGGGSGSFQLLSGLKSHRALDIRSIVSMTDSGGDSGAYRDDYGVLPPGDLRRCLVALSEESRLMRDLFQYRFDEGTLAGRSVGNLLMVALSRVLDSEQSAVAAVSQILKIRGEVVPVTWDDTHLHALLSGGTLLAGERTIDRLPAPRSPIASVYLEPAALANPRALEVIADADFIVLAPGDLYTSVAASLLVEGVREAIAESPGVLVQVMNLMTKPGETDGMGAADHVREIARYAGRTPDVVVVHQGGIPAHLQQRYEAESAGQVEGDHAALRSAGVAEVFATSLMSGHSYVRHDPDRLRDALCAVMGLV